MRSGSENHTAQLVIGIARICELRTIITNDNIWNSLLTRVRCEVNKFANERKLRIVICDDQIPSIIVVKQVCSQCVPWAG